VSREAAINVINELNGYGVGVDKYCFGLPNYDSYLEDMIAIVQTEIQK
jgi:hypothetical protein